MDDPAPPVSTGTLIQMRCPRCGAFNIYKRRVVDVAFLNEARQELAAVERTLNALVEEIENWSGEKLR